MPQEKAKELQQQIQEKEDQIVKTQREIRELESQLDNLDNKK